MWQKIPITGRALTQETHLRNHPILQRGRHQLVFLAFRCLQKTIFHLISPASRHSPTHMHMQAGTHVITELARRFTLTWMHVHTRVRSHYSGIHMHIHIHAQAYNHAHAHVPAHMGHCTCSHTYNSGILPHKHTIEELFVTKCISVLEF